MTSPTFFHETAVNSIMKIKRLFILTNILNAEVNLFVTLSFQNHTTDHYETYVARGIEGHIINLEECDPNYVQKYT